MTRRTAGFVVVAARRLGCAFRRRRITRFDSAASPRRLVTTRRLSITPGVVYIKRTLTP